QVLARLSQDFTATVSNSSDTAVTWSVTPSDSSGGLVNTHGHYTAPTTAGTYTVTATAHADPSATASATVTVDTLDVAVTPASQSLPQTGTKKFTATVTRGNGQSVSQVVTWSVAEGDSAGTIDSDGVYTAPASDTTAHVVATSQIDGVTFGKATVTVGGHAPGAPTNLVATAGNGQVALSWSGVSGATSYNVYLAPHGQLSAGLESALPGVSSGVIVRGLVNGQELDFAVTAANASGEGARSNVASATPEDTTAPGLLGYWPANHAVAVPLGAAPFANFARPMDDESLSTSFFVSATATSGTPLDASFHYDGLRAQLTPADPLDPRTSYTVRIASSAKDDSGNHAAPFSWSFTTQAEATDTFEAASGSSAVTLTWSAVPGAVRYSLYRGTQTGGPYVELASSTGLSYTDTSASNGQSWFYVLTAWTTDGEGAPSYEVEGAPSASLPTAPTLTALGHNAQIVVEWGNSFNASFTYELSRATVSGGPYDVLTGDSRATYVDNDVVNGTPYFYVVRAIDTNQNYGAFSLEVTATAGTSSLAAITDLTATNGNGWVRLDWTPLGSATRQVILRATSPSGAYAPVHDLAGSANTFVDVSASNGTSYFYVIASMSGSVQGSLSNEVEGDPATYGLAQAAILNLDYTVNDTVQLSWAMPLGAAQVELFRADPDNDFASLGTVSSPYIDTNLATGTAYQYRLDASSSGGDAVPSNIVTVNAIGSGYTAPVLAAHAGVQMVSLSFSAPSGATGYLLSWGTHSGGPYTLGQQSLGSGSQMAVVSSLANGTALYFIVTATYSDQTTTKTSNEAVATPLATLPAQPTITSLNGTDRVDLNWDSVARATGGYNVYRAHGYSGFTKLNGTPLANTVTSYIDTAVQGGQDYVYAVAPILSSVEGAWSYPVSARPSAALAEAPTNFAAHPGNATISLSWDARPGATGYYISYGTVSGGPYKSGTVYPNASAITLQNGNIANGKTLYFVVQSAMGDGTVSAYSPEISTAASSGDPDLPSVSPLEGTSGVNLSWASTPGATGYAIYRALGLGTYVKLGTTTATSYTDSTGAPEVTYSYAVAPLVSALECAWSYPVTAASRRHKPAAPANPVAHPGNAYLTLTWDPVVGASSYSIYSSAIAGGPYTYLATPNTPSFTLSQTSTATLHYVITANTQSDSSGYSAEVTTHQAASLPDLPSVTPTPGLDGILLTWPAAANSSGYHVYRQLSGTNAWTLLATTAGTSLSDPTVFQGVTYQYAVAGLTNVGNEGPWSYAVQATAGTGYALEPQNVIARAGTGTISLSWDAVVGATSYSVFSASTSGGPYQYAGNAQTPFLSALTSPNGATRYFALQANTNTTSSGYSREVAAIASATLLDAPVLNPTPDTGQVSLQWTPSEGALSTVIYRWIDGDRRYTVITATSGTTYVDKGLVDGTTVHYVAASVNANGTGAWGYESQVTVGAP
ncbi:MAG: Ig-like domain-containing protein, partial [Deltaproteobacteria bacterium]|nr:Ig-like domain-containing protein [Deltaproteobacteria bacterium]